MIFSARIYFLLVTLFLEKAVTQQCACAGCSPEPDIDARDSSSWRLDCADVGYVVLNNLRVQSVDDDTFTIQVYGATDGNDLLFSTPDDSCYNLEDKPFSTTEEIVLVEFSCTNLVFDCSLIYSIEYSCASPPYCPCSGCTSVPTIEAGSSYQWELRDCLNVGNIIVDDHSLQFDSFSDEFQIRIYDASDGVVNPTMMVSSDITTCFDVSDVTTTPLVLYTQYVFVTVYCMNDINACDDITYKLVYSCDNGNFDDGDEEYEDGGDDDGGDDDGGDDDGGDDDGGDDDGANGNEGESSILTVYVSGFTVLFVIAAM